jgi:hypothetical protein
VKPRVSTRPRRLSVLALILMGVGAFGLLRERLTSGSSEIRCAPLDQTCESDAGLAGPAVGEPRGAPTLNASDVCVDVSYLCAELERREEIRLQRWKDFEGTLVVHVPLPESVGRAEARELQRAAPLGIRLWSRRPFTILTDLRGDRDPRFTVIWSRSLSGSQIGVARTQWSPAAGLIVMSIELVSQDPYRLGRTADPRQVRLTAAHEMGHALGLQHSNARRDVMYPTNTATSLSAQDYRTIEVLYQLEDGTRIRR